MKMNIGIDLGTTNSVATYMDKGKFEYILFRNKESIPSVVLYQNDKVIVGEKAKKKAVLFPENYIKSSKTDMGDMGKIWKIDGQDITPTDVAKEILSEIKLTIAKQVPNIDEFEAVITVPAYFTSSQIDETKKAAELAGYSVKQIITEPVAAALAYGFEDNINQKIFIVDIGGGTFDTAILEVKNQDFSTVALGGDKKLGGDDFDNVILEMFLKHIRRNEGVNLASFEKSGLSTEVYVKAYHTLISKAEETKIELSEQEEVEISIANLFDNYNFEMKLNREDFESSSSYILDTIKREIERTLEDANLDASEVDKVVLVGGSARIPAIRNYVIDVFNTTPYADKPLDKLVSIGAAIAASEENAVQIRDILSHTLGIELINEKFSPIIHKNTKYPVSKTERYTTTHDYQERISVNVYEGEDDNVNGNTYYGGFALDNIQSAEKGIPQIDVTFTFDSNRMLHVTAKDINTNSSRSATIELDKGSKKKITPEQSPYDISLAIDISTSMCGIPLNKAKEAASLLVTEMIDLSMHKIGLVAFGSDAHKYLDLSNNEQDLVSAIAELSCRGSTDMAGGIKKSRKEVLDKASNKKLIILVTDGCPDSQYDTKKQAYKAREKGIKIVTIGIGNGIDRALLREIAFSESDYYEGDNFDHLAGIFKTITDSLQNK